MAMLKNLVTLALVSILVSACSGQAGSSGSGGSSSGGASSGGTTDPDPGGNFPSVGVPDHNSMSVSLSGANVRGLTFDGTTVAVTVRLADQLNNAATIADGTEVFFAAEGGSIDPMCTTTDGSCSVNWTSQAPRPAAITPELSSGRASIVIWTVGSESFNDNNSNGLFDDGDTIVADIGEAFIDKNEDGDRDTDEEFVNFPIPALGAGGGSYDGPDGLYTGPNCAHSTLCASDQSRFIFRNVIIVMSSDLVCLSHINTGAVPYVAAAPLGALPAAGTISVSFMVTDCNGNPPIEGTTVVAEAQDTGKLFGPTSFTVGSTTADMGAGPPFVGTRGVLIYTFTLGQNLTATGPGNLVVTATSPAGDVDTSVLSYTDPAPP